MCMYFFFSSRRRHTRCALVTEFRRVLFRSPRSETTGRFNDSIENKAGEHDDADRGDATLRADVLQQQSAGRQAEDRADPPDQAEHIDRSEERRVGKEGVSKSRYRWSPYHTKKQERRESAT